MQSLGSKGLGSGERMGGSMLEDVPEWSCNMKN